MCSTKYTDGVASLIKAFKELEAESGMPYERYIVRCLLGLVLVIQALEVCEALEMIEHQQEMILLLNIHLHTILLCR